jgi:small-conductance mechanosensitive channel
MMAETADGAILNEAIRLKALGNALQTMSLATEENNDMQVQDFILQVEEIGKMICEVTSTLQGKLEEWKPAQDTKGA